MESSLGDRLARLLGGSVVLPVDDLEIDELIPQAIVRPTERIQISELLLWASSEHVSVLPKGGRTRLNLGNVPRKADVVLDLGAFDRLIDYQPADMTATVEAGMTLATLQDRLAPGGEFAPLESAQPRRSTIGGILSVGAGGPLSYTYGLPREWLIGLSILGTNGISTKSGGKVVKNVTGYDLNKLYTGSMGTLGVILEASFKLLPIDPQNGMLFASFPSLSNSITASRKLIHSGSAPAGCLSATSGVTRRRQDSTLAASQDLGLGEPETALLFAFYSGRSQATRRRLEEAAAMLIAEGATAVQRIEGPAAKSTLRWITDVPTQVNEDSALVIKISVPSNSTPRTSAECGDVALFGEKPEQIADPGFGSIRLFWPKYGDIQSFHSMEPQPIIDTIQNVRETAQSYGGSAVVEQCPITVKSQIDVWGDYPDSLAIMQNIKYRFDPNSILNPGRFLGGI